MRTNGHKHALAVEAWVTENEGAIEASESADDLFDLLWPLLTKLSSEKRLSDTVPASALKALARGWLDGRSFAELLEDLDALGASYPYGKHDRGFDLDLVVDLCEQTFGFEFALLLASVKESFVARATEGAGKLLTSHVDLLQKRLKYGLPDQDCIAYYEAGFSERVIAQALAGGMSSDNAKTRDGARNLIRQYPSEFEIVLQQFPSHFMDVLRTIVAPQAG